jgi:hypothetical protein
MIVMDAGSAMRRLRFRPANPVAGVARSNRAASAGGEEAKKIEVKEAA